MTSPDPVQPQSRAQRRQDTVKKQRQERMQKYNRNKREMAIIKWGSIALAVVIVGALGFAAFKYLDERELNKAPENVVVYDYTGSNHLEGDIDYAAQADYKGEVPPAGGAHNSTAQQCDVYAQPIRTESAIHSLEHGAVWITYQPDLPQDQIDELNDIADGDPYMLMSPYEGLPAPIVLTAWNHQLQLQAFDKDTVERFIRSYQNNSDTTPEFGASCSGTTMSVAP